MVKTRKELEDSKSGWKTVALIFMISFIIVSLLMLYSVDKSEYFETQLSECQGQVEVWTLKFVCVDVEEYSKITFEQNFTNYEDYVMALELVGSKEYKLFENCEVIK